MKEERRNETKTLSEAVKARMEKSFFGSVILKEGRVLSEREEDKTNERMPTPGDTV